MLHHAFAERQAGIREDWHGMARKNELHIFTCTLPSKTLLVAAWELSRTVPRPLNPSFF